MEIVDRDWDKHFIEMAILVSKMSKDPSTKCGAVIVDSSKRVVSTGFNGFARGVEDRKEWYENRDIKYLVVIHAETNALLFAKQDLRGCTIYTSSGFTCSRCAANIIQSGITRVVCPPGKKDYDSRWGAEISLAKQMYKDAGVEYIDLGELNESN